MTCDNDGTNVTQWRPFGGCPGGEATTEVSAYARRGGKLLQRKMLCSVCSRGFIDRYSKRGHKIRQRSLTRPARMGVLEYLFGRNKRRSRIVV